MNKTLSIALAIAAGLALSACASSSPSTGGSAASGAVLTGTAQVRERMALPPDAVFEARLVDVSRADAPAKVLGQQVLSPAGQPPFAIRVPYQTSDLQPQGRYAVQASVRSGDQLLFITDTHVEAPVRTANPSVQLTLVRATTPPTGAAGPGLFGTYWKLVSLNGKPVPPAQAAAREAHFVLHQKDGRMSGSTGCNRMNAPFTWQTGGVQAPQLQFGAVGATKMACPGVDEKGFLSALQATRSYRQQGDSLNLTDAQGQVLARLQAVALR